MTTELKQAIEVLKKYLAMCNSELPMAFSRRTLKEAIDTVVSLINTGNKKGLDDSLQEKSIEVSDSQASLSNKKDRLYTDKDMEAFAEWCADSLYEYIGNRWKSYDLNRIATTSQLRELWEQERKESCNKVEFLKSANEPSAVTHPYDLSKK